MTLELVPKVRFKEFVQPWSISGLDNLGEFKNGINKGAEEFGHGKPFVNLMDVFGRNELDNPSLDLVNSTETERDLYNLLEGDVIFIRS